MKSLILIDTQFPFRGGEPFLESELPVTADRFDRVLIFPADVVTGDRQTRIVAEENVDVYPFENEKPALRKAKAAVRGLFGMTRMRGGLKTRFWDAYFEAAAKAQAKKIIRILEGYAFSPEDEIVVYSYWLYIPARIAVELKRFFQKKGIPVRAVSRAHGFDIHEKYSGKGYLPQRQLLLRELNRVYACSRDGASCLCRKFPAYTDKVGVSLLGTSDHGLCTESRRPFRIVSCSRLVALKRVELIAEAMVLLISRGFDICWTHLGDGDQMQKVRDRIPEGMEDRIHLPGAVPNTEVLDFYRDNPTDLFVNVSASEGLPVSIMEAISFGIPVIATDVGGTGEIVTEQAGTLLPPDITAEALAEHIAAYYNADPEQSKGLRLSARRFWEENFEAKTNYEKFVDELSKPELQEN